MKYCRIIGVLLAVMSVGNCFASWLGSVQTSEVPVEFWMRNKMPFPVMVWPVPKSVPPYMLAKIPANGGIAKLTLPGYVEKIVLFNANLAPAVDTSSGKAFISSLISPALFNRSNMILFGISWADFFPEYMGKDGDFNSRYGTGVAGGVHMWGNPYQIFKGNKFDILKNSKTGAMFLNYVCREGAKKFVAPQGYVSTCPY